MPLVSNSMSLVRLSRLIFVSMVVTAIVFAGAGLTSLMIVKQGNVVWDKFHSNNDPSRVLERRLLEGIGYGGLVHDFSNYILRGGDELADEIIKNAGASLAALEQLHQTHHTEGSHAQISEVETLVSQYLEQVPRIRQYQMLGGTPESIDGQISIDHTSALLALDALLDADAEALGEENLHFKGELLLQLHRNLGFGGAIHNAKLYVIRGDTAYLEAARAALDDASATVALYGDIATVETETAALASVSELISVMRIALDDAEALVARSATAAEIDAATQWSDADAMIALSALEAEIANDSVVEAKLLNEKLATAERITFLTAGLIILLLPMLSIVVNRLMAKSAVRPAEAIADAVQKLANGDTTINVDAYISETEVGRIARSCESFRQVLEANDEMSQKSRLDADKQRKLADDARRSSEEAAALMVRQQAVQVDVANHAGTIRAEVASIADAAWSLSSRTEQQSATIDKSAHSLRELTDSVGTVAGTAGIARSEMEQVATVTQDCQNTVKSAIEGMERIVSSSEEISKVTGLIDQISFQTNLLALNAGVEAARAGDAGRGFAVVASEVRDLAQRSASAASEIKELITRSTAEIKTGSSRIADAGHAISDISTLVEKVLNLVEQVAGSAQTQSEGLTALSGSVKDLDEVGKMNAAMFEETAASTTALSKNVDLLISATDRLHQTDLADATDDYDDLPLAKAS